MGTKYTESNDLAVEALNDIKSELNRQANNIEKIYGFEEIFNEGNESDEFQLSRNIDEEGSEDI